MKRPIFVRLFLSLVFALFFLSTLRAATLPPGFSEQNIGSGWSLPVGLAFDSSLVGQNRVYVWEKGGKVWIVENGVKAATPLIDLSDEVGNRGDYGLLGFALHPNFQQNGFIYLLYVVDRYHLLNAGTPGYDPKANLYLAATIGRITRYTARASDGFHSVDPSSRLVLVGESKSTGFPILHQSHGVGQLVFANDGTLLASCGDAASFEAMDDGGGDGNSYSVQGLIDGIIQPKEDVGAFRAQLVDSLSGKLIRIDPVTGNGVPSNPFYDSTKPRAPKSRVWTLGLRNPYRFTFRPETGSHLPADGQPGVIVLGDVGWNAWESIQVLDAPGQNCGWPLFEGLQANARYQASPAQNLDAPNPLGGFFKFKDLLIQDTLAAPSWPNPLNLGVQIPANLPRFVHHRPVIDMGRGTNPVGPARTGIFNGTTAAEINIGAPGSPIAGPQFGANASTGGTFYTGTDFPVSYRGTYFHADYGHGWIKNIVFGTNNRPTQVSDFAEGGQPVFVATHPTLGGLYYVDIGSAAVRKISYAPNGNIAPIAAAAATNTVGASPLTVIFSSAGSIDPDGLPLAYRWDFGDGTSSTLANPTHVYTATGTKRFDATLTVTDAGGAMAQQSVAVFVNHSLPQVTLLSPVDGTKYVLTGDSTYALTRYVQEVPGHPTTTTWNVFLHHDNHEHGEPPITAPSVLAVLSPVYSTTETYYYRIECTVTDDLGATVVRSARLFPNAVNVPPVVKWSAAQKARSLAATAQILDAAATVTDADSPGLEFGALRVALTGGAPADKLTILPQGKGVGQVNLTGTAVSYGGVNVGAVTGGTGGQPLVVVLNEAATPVAAQAILRSVAAIFSTPGVRVVNATLNDGDGGISAAASLTVQVVNQPPIVALTNPPNGATLTAPAAISLMASASDPDGSVTKVEFFNGATKLGESTKAPFRFIWNNVAAGTYALTAQATDNFSAMTKSSAVSVVVAKVSGLPAPWQTSDVGAVGAVGSANFVSGTFTLTGAGNDNWDSADQFRYVWQPWKGDGEIVARLAAVGRVTDDSIGGLMIRETLATNSKDILLGVLASGRAIMQWRTNSGGTSGYAQGPVSGPPSWLKLRRSASIIEGFVSADGIAWTRVGAVSVSMSATCYFGLVAGAVNPDVSSAAAKATVVFTNISGPRALP